MTEKKKKDLQTDGYGNQQNGIKQLDEYKNLVNQKTSALSSANQANKQALKYADNTALAQGYATQGAALQNMTNLQNAYQNQVGGINQQYQQQLGNLKNTNSANVFTDYETMLANELQQGTLTEETLKKIDDQLLPQMSGNDLFKAMLMREQYTNQISTEQDLFKAGVNAESTAISTKDILTTNKPKDLKQQLGDKISSSDLTGIKNLINSGLLKNEDVITMSGKQYIYVNGKFYKTSGKQSTYSIGLGTEGYTKSN